MIHTHVGKLFNLPLPQFSPVVMVTLAVLTSKTFVKIK